MKLPNLFAKIMSLSLAASLVMVSSCKEDDERLTARDTQDITEEALTDAYFQDMDDLGGVTLEAPADAQYNGGRVASTITITDDRFKCAVVTIEASGSADSPQGLIVVDFGTGCVDKRLNIRKGKLKFAYNGRRFQPGSTVVLNPDNYSINDIKLEGTRISTNLQGSTSDAPKFNVVLSNGKATFPDASIAERESDITWEWIRSANDPSDDYLIIKSSSTASGTTRGGRSYDVSLVEDLKYKRFCGIAVDGIKRYIIDEEKEIVIDYGDGTCDKAVTITINGVTRNISVN